VISSLLYEENITLVQEMLSHSDDFDDSVRTAMGIARYADTAKRFREKKFFTDNLATNPKVELAA
jgi:hypothetical protein